MIDLEIDGNQHYLDERIVESDKRRTEYLENQGWTIVRVRWSEYQKLSKHDRESYVADLIAQLF
jgi:very-short-patch-repair endonuclease